jgi:hypothetical protein
MSALRFEKARQVRTTVGALQGKLLELAATLAPRRQSVKQLPTGSFHVTQQPAGLSGMRAHYVPGLRVMQGAEDYAVNL